MLLISLNVKNLTVSLVNRGTRFVLPLIKASKIDQHHSEALSGGCELRISSVEM